MKHPVICIPRINRFFSAHDIQNVFDTYKFGTIEKINIVTGVETNKVFIKYSYWNQRDQTRIFRGGLMRDETMKIFHEFPSFWKCYKSFDRK